MAVIRAAIVQENYDAAQTLLAASRFDRGDLGYEAAFYQAIIFREGGRLEDAITLLRQIVTERPDIRGARFELAQTLALDGQRDAAEYHLGILAESASSAAEREQFESAIDLLERDNRFSFTGFVTIAPSTNFSNGASTDTIRLFGLPFEIENTEQSGVGLSYGGTGIFAQPIGRERQLFFATGAQFNEFPGSEFDNRIFTLRGGIQFGPPLRRLTLELVTDRRDVDGELSDTSQGGRVAARYPLAPRWLADAEFAFADREFERSDDRLVRDLEFTLRHAVASNVSVSGGVIVEDTRADTDFNSFGGRGVVLGAARQFANGLVVDGQVEYVARNYDEDFVGLGDRREDRITRVRLSALSSRLQFRGIAPRVSLTYTRQNSNVPIFDFDAYGAELTLTRSF